MKIDELFRFLDLDADGRISRDDLFQAASSAGWHWHEAPLFAVLDRLCLQAALDLKTFIACFEQIMSDPYGPYGDVLLRMNHPSSKPATASPPPSSDQDLPSGDPSFEKIEVGQSALLIIDPQKSFTQGVWMQSIGSGGTAEVEPIARAFANCETFLAAHYGRVPCLFTRCPFPPTSYTWDDGVAKKIDAHQPYFIKPGNSVLWPPTNGFEKTIRNFAADDIDTLVIGGCTLNSCVRVSAVEAQRAFEDLGLQVVVDLNLCGARKSNYEPSELFEGKSPVEAAIDEMTAAGVKVAQNVEIA